MTQSNPFELEITSEEAFQSALSRLLTAAVENDVDIRGSWIYRSDDINRRDWETMIIELGNDSESG